VEPRILAAVDIQMVIGRIRNVVRTENILLLVEDSAMAVDIADHPKSALLDECRKVDSPHIRLCFPCFSLWLYICSVVY